MLKILDMAINVALYAEDMLRNKLTVRLCNDNMSYIHFFKPKSSLHGLEVKTINT